MKTYTLEEITPKILDALVDTETYSTNMGFHTGQRIKRYPADYKTVYFPVQREPDGYVWRGQFRVGKPNVIDSVLPEIRPVWFAPVPVNEKEAVEFAEWVSDNEEWYFNAELGETGAWFTVRPNDGELKSSAELYQLFLNNKQ